MNDKEFGTVMNLLVETFGERHYPPPTSSRIWRIVRRITKAEFENAVERLCEDQRHAPLAGEIRRVCAPALQRAREAWIRSQVGDIGQKCRWCDNTAHCFAVKNGAEHLQFQFRCQCRAADIIDPKGLPAWNVTREREFTRVAFDASELREEYRLACYRRGQEWREMESGPWMRLAKQLMEGRGVEV